jgi:uncharacterized membrane protein
MALAQIVMLLSALLALLALVLDGAAILSERRHAQAVADAAALSAAADLFVNYPTNNGADTGSTAKASALLTANNNGYPNNGTSSTVTVNIPPQSGDHVGQAGYAEVIVTYNQTRFFSNLWGKSNIPVMARAVARG